jgi:GTP-binding protein
MKIKEAIFKGSSSNYKQCPRDKRPELAFIGRSNVGKSSLINMLLGQKGLAKVSGTPGKTQLINHFLVNDSYYLVDLPGYGWARTSKVNRGNWQKMVTDYLLHRESLLCVFVLIDGRHEPQQIDLDFIQWLGENSIPWIMLITKADKVSKQQLQVNLNLFKQELHQDGDLGSDFLITSAHKQTGRLEVLGFIENMVKEAL